MSQAIIEFCDTLKTTLLGLEARLARAEKHLESGTAKVQEDARRQIAEASELLASFKATAGRLASELKTEAVDQRAGLDERLKTASLEAQVALRHAAVVLAEAASKGAAGAATALSGVADQARGLAEKLRHETAVTVPEPEAARRASAAE